MNIDLADEEVNPNLESLDNETSFKNEYTYKLAKLIQLSGYSDPIYAEAFVDIHKYDILFEILIVNQTSKRLQNVRVEFSTQGDNSSLDQTPSIILGPNESKIIKSNMKIATTEVGIIFGSINYENIAGIE